MWVFWWIFISFLISLIGSGRSIGWFASFFICLLLSPIIGLVITLASERKQTALERKKMLELEDQQAALLHARQTALLQNQASVKLAHEIQELKDMLESGTLTPQEYDAAIKMLLDE